MKAFRMQYKYMRTLFLGSLCAAVFLAWAGPCYGETEDQFVGAEAPDAVDEPSASDDLSKWFVVFGAGNVHPRLEISEARIDRQINRVFGTVLPRWSEPRTFRDWRDEFRLWDFHVGFGRDLSPNWVWASTAGGTAGTVRNRDRYYPAGIPTMFHIDFSRKLWFVSTGLFYYPCGQSVFDQSPGAMGRLERSLRGTRPFVGCVAGYIDLTVEGKVKLDFPLTPFTPRIVHKDHIRPFYISPRIGVDVPITRRNELVLAAGYLFFNEDSADLNNLSLYLMFKHRFASKKRG